MNDIAVVICNYNKKDFVLNCIESVFKSSFKNFDLIVVDNASTDDSVEAIKVRFGDKLTLLVNEENLGGSGGFNRGMQYAMDKGHYKYIHLLDNDAVIDKNAIKELYQFMEDNPIAGACGSLIMRMDDTECVQDLGGMIEPENLGVKALYCNQRNVSLPEKVECDYVAACSAIYRTDVLKKTGTINKEFFIYWDDMALSWEIRLAGYKVFACSKSKVWHAHTFTFAKDTFGIYYFFRNKIHCFVKYLDDEAYAKLGENIVKRLFRTFSTGKDRSFDNFSYFHAINDVLNGVTGKAEAYKIIPRPFLSEKFINIIKDKKNILICYDESYLNFHELIDKLKNATQAELAVVTHGIELAKIENIAYINNAPNNNSFDLTIKLCHHILDLKNPDKAFVYIDRYHNQILDDDDFDYYNDLNEKYPFFHNIFYQFVQSKLDALRKKLRDNVGSV